MSEAKFNSSLTLKVLNVVYKTTTICVHVVYETRVKPCPILRLTALETCLFTFEKRKIKHD